MRTWRALALACALAPAGARAEALAGRATVTGRVQVVSAAGRAEQPMGPVVVFVEDLREGFPPPALLEIRQRNKQFHPRFLLVPLDGTVSFPNDDAVDHNVFSLSPVSSFDLGYYGAGVARQVRFDKPGAVRLYCNIHPGMIADVLVLANPYFARVGADGGFRIQGVPAGRRALRAWFPLGPSQAVNVDVPPGATASADFRLHATVATSSHENKHGEPYFLDYQR